MKRSSDPQSVLDQYRASLSASAATRQQVWEELAPRAAAGEPPTLPSPPSPPTVPVAPAGLGWSPVLLVGAGALLIGGVWSWQAQRAPGARPVPDAVQPAQGSSDPQPPADVATPDGAASSPPASGDAFRSASGDAFRSASGDASRAASGERPAASEWEPARRARPRGRSAEPAPAGGHATGGGAASQSAALGAPVKPPGATASSEVNSAFIPFSAGSDRAPRASAREPGATAAEPALDEELRLLRGAYEALRSDRPGRALRRLGEHAARFPHGALAEARDVARIMALCQDGQRAAARAEAAQFLARAPRSPHAARVRSLCAEGREPP